MPLVKCPHCPQRVRPKQLPLHLKKCIAKRRKDKAAGSEAQKEIYAADQARIDADLLAKKRAQLQEREVEFTKELEALRQAEQVPMAPKPTTKKGKKK
jgi:hypothetical protein